MESHETVPIVRCSEPECRRHARRGYWENKKWVWQLDPDGRCFDHALKAGKRIEHHCGGVWVGNVCSLCDAIADKSSM